MLRFVALAFAAAVLLAACGGGDSGGTASPLAALVTAVEKTGNSESYRADVSLKSDLGGDELRLIVSGTFTADSARGRLEGRINEGEGRLGFRGIVIDDLIYLHPKRGQLPGGKEWISVRDPGASPLSPSEFTEFLLDSKGVRNFGTEQIRGERTTHFRGPIDVEKLAEESGPAIVERLRRFPQAKDMKFVVDVWVAQDGLPSRLSGDISVPGLTGSLKIESDIFEYDVEVDVEKPPPDTVMPARSLSG
jgi:hypothetical protein